MTIALRGPTFMKVWAPPLGVSRTAVTSSSGASAVRLTPSRNSSSGSDAHAAHARELDLRALDEERWQRVAGGRGSPEVAADRAPVADLRRADGARGLGERGQLVRERRRHRLGVGQGGAEAEAAVLPRPTAQLLELGQVHERGRPRLAEGQLDHHVGAAQDEPRLRALGLQAQRVVERARREELHLPNTSRSPQSTA